MGGRAARAQRGTRDLFRWAAGLPAEPARDGAPSASARPTARPAWSRSTRRHPASEPAPEVREFGRPFVREHRGLRPPKDPGEPETYARRGRRSGLCARLPVRAP